MVGSLFVGTGSGLDGVSSGQQQWTFDDFHRNSRSRPLRFFGLHGHGAFCYGIEYYRGVLVCDCEDS